MGRGDSKKTRKMRRKKSQSSKKNRLKRQGEAVKKERKVNKK